MCAFWAKAQVLNWPCEAGRQQGAGGEGGQPADSQRLWCHTCRAVCHGQCTGWRHQPRRQSPAPTIGRVRAWVALATGARVACSPCAERGASKRGLGLLVSWCHGANVAATQCTHLREGAERARAGESVIGRVRGGGTRPAAAWRAASGGARSSSRACCEPRENELLLYLR